MEKTLLGFNADITGGTGTRYLVLTRPGLNPHEIGFEAEMIANNRIPGIVHMDVREKDGTIAFRYHIGSLITAANYFKKKKVGRNEFITVLERVVSVLVDCGRHLLHDSALVLDENHIYIDPGTHEVFLLYIPVPAEIVRDTAGAVRSLVFSLLVNSGSLEPEEMWIRQMLSLVKADGFNLVDFRQSLRAMKDSGEPVPEAGAERLEAAYPGGDAGPKPHKWVGPETADLEAEESGRPAKRKLVLVLLAAVFLTAGYVSNSDMVTAGRWPALRYLPAGSGYLYLFGAALIPVILIALLTYCRKRLGQKEPVASASAGCLDEPGVPWPDEGLTDANAVTPQVLLPGADPDETALLGSSDYPALYSLNSTEVIVIDKARFTVGRNRDSCDYVIDNKSIGRIHALIEEVEGEYYLTDLDTKNGTFINGAGLLSNKPYRLHNLDRVSLANLDFCFKTNA